MLRESTGLHGAFFPIDLLTVFPSRGQQIIISVALTPLGPSLAAVYTSSARTCRSPDSHRTTGLYSAIQGIINGVSRAAVPVFERSKRADSDPCVAVLERKVRPPVLLRGLRLCDPDRCCVTEDLMCVRVLAVDAVS